MEQRSNESKLYSVYYNEFEIHTNEYVVKANSKKEAKNKITSLIKKQYDKSDFKKREKACDDLMNYLIGGSITQLHYDYLETVASDLSEHEGLKYKQWQDPSQEGRLTEEYIKKLGEFYGTEE